MDARAVAVSPFVKHGRARKVEGKLSIEEKDRDDVMQRLLELGGDKKYLTFDDLNRELPDNVVSPVAA